MKNQNKLHAFIKWAEAELGLALAMLVMGTVMISGATAYVSPTPMDVGDISEPSINVTAPKATQMVINQIPVDGLNFTAQSEGDLFKVADGWLGSNQDLITTSRGTRGVQENQVYTYRVNLDHPYNGTLWLAGNYQSARVNGTYVTPAQALVKLNNASTITLNFKGGDKNTFATLT